MTGQNLPRTPHMQFLQNPKSSQESLRILYTLSRCSWSYLRLLWEMVIGLPCWMHPAVHMLLTGASYASLTPGPGEHLSPCVSPSYASARRHVGQKAGSTRNVHAPHPASGVSRRTLEGMLFCLGRATQSNYDGSGHHNLQELWTFELQLPGCKQDPAKTKHDEA